MIEYLTNKEIDRERWDACLSRSANGLLYGYSWYLDEIGAWDGLVLGDYQAVMPLTFRQKLGVRYLFVPYSAQQLGVFSPELLTEKQVVDFIQTIPTHFRYVDIRLNQGNDLSEGTFSLIQHRNQEIDLSPEYEQLKAAYDQNLRRNLKKAARSEWEIQQQQGKSEEIIQLFRKNKGETLSHLEEEFYLTLSRLYQVCREKGWAETWCVTDKNGQLEAGLLIFKDDRRIYSMLTAVSPEGRKGQAVHCMIDRVIQNYAGQPLVLDFEGSNEPGLARFNLQFGAKDCLYLQLKKNHLPRGIKWLKK